MNRYEQATEGLDITTDGGVVRVQDGNDTWLCTGKAWAEARTQLSVQAALEDDEDGPTGAMLAYAALCRAVDGPVLTCIGSDKGTEAARRELARKAAAVDLLPEALASLAEG